MDDLRSSATPSSYQPSPSPSAHGRRPRVAPPSKSSRRTSSSARNSVANAAAGANGPTRNKRTFMACTECRRRQVKCNPAPGPGNTGNPCERCSKRKIKCQFLTRQEQQLQASNECTDPAKLDSSSVILSLPNYGTAHAQPPAQMYHTGMPANYSSPNPMLEAVPYDNHHMRHRHLYPELVNPLVHDGLTIAPTDVSSGLMIYAPNSNGYSEHDDDPPHWYQGQDHQQPLHRFDSPTCNSADLNYIPHVSQGFSQLSESDSYSWKCL